MPLCPAAIHVDIRGCHCAGEAVRSERNLGSSGGVAQAHAHQMVSDTGMMGLPWKMLERFPRNVERLGEAGLGLGKWTLLMRRTWVSRLSARFPRVRIPALVANGHFIWGPPFVFGNGSNFMAPGHWFWNHCDAPPHGHGKEDAVNGAETGR